MLHEITMYYVNEVSYNEALIGLDVGFVISRDDCILNFIELLINQNLKRYKDNKFNYHQ